MSIMSLLSTQGCVDLRLAWRSLDFDRLGISFVCEDTDPLAIGILSYHGVSFAYDIQSMTHVKAAQYIFCSADMGDVRSAIHFDLGPAVHEGGAVPAIAMALMQLGEVLGRSFRAKAVFWKPASILSGFEYFAEAVTQYSNNAAFPSLICVQFDTTDQSKVETHGLKWFCGQELVFKHTPMATPDAMRYMVRLVHNLATQGAISREIEVSGMQSGETILLTPSTHNDIVIAEFFMPE